MKYITHPLIRPESLEERRYQLAIALHALEGNTMVVLPTGLGKTAIALIAAASRIHNKGGRVLVMAPTKPLVEQHLRFFGRLLLVPGRKEGDPSPFVMFTGETPPEERKAAWAGSRLCFATPQAVKNDLLAGRYTLADVTLLVVDECHRAVGNYAYVFIAKRYMETAADPLILAMTASPGGDREKVEEVCGNLSIARVESRVESDEDVRPYVHEREIHYVPVDLPKELGEALGTLNGLIAGRINQLERLHFQVPKPGKLSIRALTELNAQIQRRIQGGDRSAYQAASVHAEIMKLRHAVSLAETQGSEALRHYLEKLSQEGTAPGGSKASQRLGADPAFRRLVAESSLWTGELHQKLELVGKLVQAQLAAHPDSRIIVFATYRDTVQNLVNHLATLGIHAERFVGQATKDAERGLTQKMQIEALQRFRQGEFRVLIATSVGEEGLDVPSTDMVIFYEAVPSEIRSIQRKGRTGRSGAGKIVVLVTKGTSDEVYRYVSQTRERAMVTGMRSLRGMPPARQPGNQATLPPAGGPPGPGMAEEPVPGPTAPDGLRRTASLTASVAPAPLPPHRSPEASQGQTAIGSFIPGGPAIVADDRETSSRVVEHLSNLGVRLELRRLDHGDYLVGDRILVERKTARDFADTLVERDLFGQVRDLAMASTRPVLIIEGGDIYTARDLNPAAIRGALAAIAVDLGVAVFFTPDELGTAQMILTLARREEGDRGERKLHPYKSYRSAKEQQEFILASFPSVGLRNARLLLAHFGSVKAVLDADEEALRAVKGIGEKTARQIYEIARQPYR
ncbi:MAG: DEAD/DEAH box helicase [Methanomicrobiales archaeon]|nr:DEAD/DEAH box helicase [Methanomicrobiales archaeon]